MWASASWPVWTVSCLYMFEYVHIKESKGVPSSCLTLCKARNSPGGTGEYILNSGIFYQMPKGNMVTPILSYSWVFQVLDTSLVQDFVLGILCELVRQESAFTALKVCRWGWREASRHFVIVWIRRGQGVVKVNDETNQVWTTMPLRGSDLQADTVGQIWIKRKCILSLSACRLELPEEFLFRAWALAALTN